MKKHLALAWILVGSLLALIPITVFLKTSASNSNSRPAALRLARLSDQTTVRAAGRGAPRINLADGHEVLTAYEGNAEAIRLLEQNIAQPLAVAASDYDGDGVPDLVSGYSTPNGGIVTLHRGNVDSIHPNTPDAQRRRAAGTFTEAPFLSPAHVFETPGPADFIGCGDFDADGKMDIVTATRGGHALYFLRGDGRGNLATATPIELSGPVSSLVIGEINRPDGLADIVVALSGTNCAKALVFQAAGGALRGDPESFALPAETTAVVLGQLDSDGLSDLALASGRGVTILHGHDHRASVATKTKKGQAAILDRRSFPFVIRSLIIGDFSGHRCDEIALLADDGTVHLLSREGEDLRRRSGKPVRVQDWPDETLPGAWRQAGLLASGGISSLPTDDLLVLDSVNRKVHILGQEPAMRGKDKVAIRESLDVEGEPVAVLPMRLNSDALSDLVILRRGQVAPSSVVTRAMMTFTVTNTGDSGAGSLRQAITDANTTAGMDVIDFNIGVGPQTILLDMPLPAITDAVTIDGTTQPGFDGGTPLIELRGDALLMPGPGLFVTSGSTMIRGLIIDGFPLDGIVLQSVGGNVIEGNSIGADGNPSNSGNGVFINGTSANTIGGTTGASLNSILNNVGAGVFVGSGSSNTLVLGNHIGVPGGASSENGTGVVVSNGVNNFIGGNSPGAGNVISGNTGAGVFIGSGSGNVVQGNLIGTGVDGISDLGNKAGGVVISQGSTNNSVGGISSGAENLIAFNGTDGVAVPSGTGNAILRNSIFSNIALGINIGDDLITANDDCDLDTGPNDLQNFPMLMSAASNGSSTTVTGTLNSTASSTFRVEFFSNPTCDPSGFGQGQTFLGATSVTADGTCNGAISVTLPVAVPAGQVITATATNVSNSTSEFSQCVTVVSAGFVSDLQITKSDSPDPVVTGSNITYTIAVLNNGPDADAGVIFTDVIPTGTTFVSLTSPGSCSTPPVGGTGTVSCSLGAIASGESVAISLVVNVTAAPGATITNTAMVSGMSADSNGANNSATASTAVMAGPCTITCPPTQIKSNDSNQCGAVVTYPAPTASGSCGSVTCTPASGSFFPKGTTVVTCNTIAGPSCAFNVTVNDTQPPTITCPPNQTVAANVATVVNYPSPTATDNCPGVSTACNPPSGSTFPVGATTVTCIATDMSGNTASCNFTVTVASCALTCPPDLLVSTSPNATSCGAIVTYSPTTSGACGTVNCSPPSGSFFNPGAAAVTCTTSSGSSCSFTVTVEDNTPPRVFCPPSNSLVTPPGQSSAVVNYEPAGVTDNCPGASVACSPPSGSRFPVGLNVVNCTGTDSSSNSATCTFFINVFDPEAPIINCPVDVNVAPSPGQTSAVVNYPPPTVTDNLPGASAICSPVSGSSFPLGLTTVTCTATDAGGNKSSCSFRVGVGGPQTKVTIPGNKAAIEFPTVSPSRKPPKPKKNPCSLFTIENIGFAPLVLTLDSISRTGADVDNKRITDPNDTRFFTVSLLNADQSLTPIDIGGVLTLQPGKATTLCVKFAALIPAPAGKTTGLSASDVLPDTITSKITFRQNAGASIAVPLLVHVSTGVVLINPANPRTPPIVIFTRSGNDITVSYAVFDSNLDVSRAKYEFLDASGQVVAGPFEVDLTEQLRSLNLVRGQSFTIEQRFTGASDSPFITGVRVTVFDGETSVTGDSSTASTSSIKLLKRASGVTLLLPDLRLRPQLP